jgi:uncharacterized protein (TIGR02284 family)
MPDNKNARETLQSLIQTCVDGENGYFHAATLITDPEIKNYFTQQSLERARFAKELKEAVERLGEPEPEVSGTVAATLHRAWFHLKADFGAGDQGVLESVELGEDSAKRDYEQAVAADLPEDVLTVIRAQRERVIAAHDRVRDLRNRGRVDEKKAA